MCAVRAVHEKYVFGQKFLRIDSPRAKKFRMGVSRQGADEGNIESWKKCAVLHRFHCLRFWKPKFLMWLLIFALIEHLMALFIS